MQIHELNSRTPTDTDEMALDTGSQTYKTRVGLLKPQFVSYDIENPTSWTNVPLTTGNSSITFVFERLTRMFSNIRYLWKLIGSNDFSNVAETISGAIGNTALTTTATDISGAIAEHEEDISTINGNLDVNSVNTQTASVYNNYITVPSTIHIDSCSIWWNKYVLSMRITLSKTDGTAFATGRSDSNPLFTLKDAYKPFLPITFPVVTNANVNGYMTNYADCYIAASGNCIVDVPSTNTNSKQMQISCTYIPV